VLEVARWKYRTQKLAKKSPSGHHRTTLSDHIYTTTERTYRQSENNMLSSNISSRCPHNMVTDLLAAEIGPVVWGTPANVNGFRVLAALLHGSQVVSVSKTFGIEQRASLMFGRASITLGIGPHSSSCFIRVAVRLKAKFHYTGSRAGRRPGFRPVADRLELSRHVVIARTWS